MMRGCQSQRSLVTRFGIAACGLAAAAGPVFAQADHLVISEVGYDGINETATQSGEFVEVFNPTSQTVDLSKVYVSDSAIHYFKVSDAGVVINPLNGQPQPISGPHTSSDWIYQFPAGTTLAPGGVAVVCEESATFLADFFPATGLAGFLATGAQLFEVRVDTDAVPTMIAHHLLPSNGPILNMTNGNETVILYRYDGFSDLVEDLDVVVWANGSTSTTTFADILIDKTNATSVGLGNPQGSGSTYEDDLGTVASQARAPANAYFAAPIVASVTPAGTARNSIQRVKLAETSELLVNGNGATGHDESTENWADTFQGKVFSPGVPDPAIGKATIGVPAAPVSLGDTPFGGTSSGAIRVTNTGTAMLVVTAINVSGSALNEYQVDQSGLPRLVPAGQGIDIDVDFTASASFPGTRDVTVTLQSNDTANPSRQVTVTARAVEAPAIAVTSAALAQGTIRFPSAVVGSQGSSVAITISNTAANAAAADLSVSAFVFSPAGGAFSIDNASPVAVPRTQAVTRTLIFRPTAAGTVNGTLTITSNDPQRPVTVINLTGASIDFGRTTSDGGSGGGGGCTADPEAPAGVGGLSLLALAAALALLRRRSAAA